VATLLIVGFSLAGLYGLGTFPAVSEDEPWMAAPGYGFWTTGRFAAEMFRGYYGMDRHYFGFMPLFPMLVGAAMRVFGPDLAHARWVPLALGVLTLALTYRVGSRLCSPRHGLLAVAILVLWPIAERTTYFPSGIPLMDLARFVRNDIAVPPFVLLAVLWSWPSIERARPPSSARAFCVGALMGMATLGHVYALFSMLALFGAAAWCCGKAVWRSLLPAGAGWLAAMAPWLIYAGSSWGDFRAQNQHYRSRFALLDWRFYVENLTREPDRFQSVIAAFTHRISAPIWGAGVVLGIAVLVSRARTSGASRVLLCLLLTNVILFALMLEPKYYTYTATLWPLFALTAANGIDAAWAFAGGRASSIAVRKAAGGGARGRSAGGGVPRGRPFSALQACLALLLLCPIVAGVRSDLWLAARARDLTPWSAVARRLAEQMPRGARLLALQRYAFGLSEHVSFQSILVPIFLADERYTGTPVTFLEAADRLAPELFLVDPILREYMATSGGSGQPYARQAGQMRDYLRARRARLAGVVDDPGYGRFEIYALDRPPPP
jgi:hypothetical protein